MANQKGIKRLSVILVVAMLLSLIPATLGFAQEVDTKKVEAFVTRLYEASLDREPDADGLKYWTRQLSTHKQTAAQAITFILIESKEFQGKNLSDSAFLDTVYKAFFNRAADADGKAYWTKKLDQGYSRRWVMQQMVGALSGEFKKLTDAAGIVAGKVTGVGKDDLPLGVTFVASSAKSLKVSFGKPVDTSKVSFAVTRDGLKVDTTTTWNDAKTEATLAVSYRLIAGKYAVTAKVGDVTKAGDVVVVDEYVAKIQFLTENLILTANKDNKEVTTPVRFFNQYGEDITSSASNVTAIATKGGAVVSNGVATLTDTTSYSVDQKVIVTIMVGTLVESKTLTVAQAANIASIVIGDLVTTDKKDVFQNTNFADGNTRYFPVEVKDQYGNLLTQSQVAGQIVVHNINPTVAKAEWATVNNKLALKLVTPDATRGFGPAYITLLASNGRSASAMVTVKQSAGVDVFNLLPPQFVVKQGETFEMPFEAFNQYGDKLTKASDLPINGGTGSVSIGIVGGTLSSAINYSKGGDSRVLRVTPAADAKQLVFTVITPTAKVQQLTVPVEAAPVPAVIGGLNWFVATALEQGQEQDLDHAWGDFALTFKDQYGADNWSVAADGDANATYTWKIEYAASKDASARNVVYDEANAKFVAHSSNYGTEGFKATLKKDGRVIDVYNFTMESVRKRDITSYGIGDLGKLYSGSVYAHELYYEVYGLKGETKVKVNQNVIVHQTVTGGLDADTAGIVKGTANTDGKDYTAKLNVVVEGFSSTTTITKDVVYSSAAPAAQGLVIRNTANWSENDPVIDLSAAAGNNFYSWGYGFLVECFDQYGVRYKNITPVVTNAGGNTITFDMNAGTLSFGTTPNLGDSFSLTLITPNGLQRTVKFYVVAN